MWGGSFFVSSFASGIGCSLGWFTTTKCPAGRVAFVEVGPGEQMDQSVKQQVELASAELEQVRDEWMHRSGVTGIDIGFLWQGKTMSDQIGIRVKVEKLLEPDDVPVGELFPGHLGEFRVQVREEPQMGPQTPG